MLNHLIELRKRIIHVLLVFTSFFLLFFFFANHLLHTVFIPLLKTLPESQPIIATQITSPLITPIQLAVNAATLCSMPFILWQIWCFVAPGLYQRERHNLRRAFLSSVVLFVLGMLFCFYLVLPFMFQFFAKAVPSDVRFMPDMTYALDFITRMLLLFGFCFQVPLVCLTLIHLKLIDLGLLKTIRPYVIVVAFILGMLLTPPDVVSQITLAIPLCLLYELGIFFATLHFSKLNYSQEQK
ncbi:twin-arginine translocase subunit TatC [Legionella fairfieldensis]|uniref:twin-arginine translocase subunit TatC n=1 Tax=Legionella fairfieldensis TaxID=45064 RepID=UPI00048D73E2|nr:twin-arginine translocase subunit TatC [Legionella fairfieldensis]